MSAQKSCLDCRWNKPMLVYNECAHDKAKYKTQGRLSEETARHTTIHMRKTGPCGEQGFFFERRF